jgi:FkbM family methyltransferase
MKMTDRNAAGCGKSRLAEIWKLRGVGMNKVKAAMRLLTSLRSRPQSADVQRQTFDRLSSLGPEPTVDDVFYCFRLILGRHPNMEDLKAHACVAQFTDLKHVVQSYLQSKEFAAREMLTTISKPILKRFPDFCIYVDPLEPFIGRGIAAGNYEPGVEAIFRKCVRPGMTVLDIGANVGFFTMLAASLVGPEGRVVAFEPNSNNVRMLEASRRANGFENVQVHCLAASDAPGILAFDTAYSNGIAASLGSSVDGLLGTAIIPAIDADRLLADDQPVHFIKIDVEGGEYRALNGMRRTLSRYRPTIVSEFYPGVLGSVSGVSPEEYLRFLMGQKYSIAVVEDNSCVTTCDNLEAVMATYQRRGVNHIDLLLTPV